MTCRQNLDKKLKAQVAALKDHRCVEEVRVETWPRQRFTEVDVATNGLINLASIAAAMGLVVITNTNEGKMPYPTRWWLTPAPMGSFVTTQCQLNDLLELHIIDILEDDIAQAMSGKTYRAIALYQPYILMTPEEITDTPQDDEPGVMLFCPECNKPSPENHMGEQGAELVCPLCGWADRRSRFKSF